VIQRHLHSESLDSKPVVSRLNFLGVTVLSTGVFKVDVVSKKNPMWKTKGCRYLVFPKESGLDVISIDPNNNFRDKIIKESRPF
jgi:hypothetical protein